MLTVPGDGRPIRFPVNGEQRRRNRLGRHAVGCIVTDRWLQFDPTSQRLSDGHDAMRLDVMTMSYPPGDEDGKPRKLAEMIVYREDLERLLANVLTKER